MTSLCILGIDPVPRGCAFAVWDNEVGLVDYGTSESRSSGPHRIVLKNLIARFEPTLVVLESGKGSKRRGRFLRIAASLEDLAGTRGVSVARVARQLRREDGSLLSKREAAIALASRYPQLASKLPRVRRPWISEDRRSSVFDALALVENFLLAARERAASGAKRSHEAF
jgi:hypothetical protein